MLALENFLCYDITSFTERKTLTQTRRYIMQALDYDALLRIVPAAFAESEAEHLSDRYTFINSYNVVQQFAEHGYFPVSAFQSFSTIDAEHGKHIIKLRHASQLDAKNANGVSELAIDNSHNGSSKLRLLIGIYRKVCSNGLIAFCAQGSYSEKHDVLTLDSVNAGILQTIEQSLQVVERCEAMQAITLTRQQAEVLAELVKIAVYNDREIESSLLLKPRRSYDVSQDLWTVFNVIQENVIKGGIESKSIAHNKSKTRPITQIDRSVNVNQMMWQVADDMLEELA